MLFRSYDVDLKFEKHRKDIFSNSLSDIRCASKIRGTSYISWHCDLSAAWYSYSVMKTADFQVSTSFSCTLVFEYTSEYMYFRFLYF